jgi:hypothetical protein
VSGGTSPCLEARLRNSTDTALFHLYAGRDQAPGTIHRRLPRAAKKPRGYHLTPVHPAGKAYCCLCNVKSTAFTSSHTPALNALMLASISHPDILYATKESRVRSVITAHWQHPHIEREYTETSLNPLVQASHVAASACLTRTVVCHNFMLNLHTCTMLMAHAAQILYDYFLGTGGFERDPFFALSMPQGSVIQLVPKFGGASAGVSWEQTRLQI